MYSGVSVIKYKKNKLNEIFDTRRDSHVLVTMTKFQIR